MTPVKPNLHVPKQRRVRQNACATLRRERRRLPRFPAIPSPYPHGKNMMNKRFLGSSTVALLLVSLAAVSCGDDNDTRTSSAPETACQAITNDGSTVVVGSNLPGDPALPEPASGYRVGLKAVTAKNFIVATSNPFASKAGCAVLNKGGTAADAAVAVQAVLGLTVPEATGLGSGGFIMYYDAATKTVQAYDGRESAPAAATENYLRYIDDVSDQRAPQPSARASGRSIGTIGIPRLIEKVQKDHGKLAWKDLFTDAIDLSTNGFKIGGRLAAAISSNANNLRHDAEATALYFNADGTPKPVGTLLTNPAYAKTLTAMANNGADVIYTGQIAQDIVNKIGQTTAANDGSPMTPGKTTLSDLAAYQIKVRTPVCTTYRTYYVCGMPPPTSGGITVASALGILENFTLEKPTTIDLEGGKPTAAAVHLVSEAERLAYADRDMYVADTDFVPLPGNTWDTLLNKPYLQSRAAMINLNQSMGTASAGNFGPVKFGIDRTEENGTNHFVIVDGSGNVVSATTTVESSMGSFHMTNGFLLNNQLTDFSATPTDNAGNLIANRVAPGKRPRSSMAPTLVFKLAANGSMGDFYMATGSPGGGTIPQYVVKTLVGALDWGLDAQQSANLIDFGASNSPTTSVGGENPNVDTSNGGNNDPLITGLRARGHTVATGAQGSGINSIIRTTTNGRPSWTGGTDPRREGLVLGDNVAP
jgi:gamma-glutamyltranspeptidase/glutathione hydrolase